MSATGALRGRGGAAVALALLSACATKGQVRLLQGELNTIRIETARRDSVRAAALAAIIALQQRTLDSLAAGREAFRTLDVRLKQDLTDVQRQLLVVQELTGQSQRRLTEMKSQLDARAEQAEAAGMTRSPAPVDTATHAPVLASPATPSADQMYQAARQQFLRGSLTTARRGMQDYVKAWPTHAQVPDALYYVGEAFRLENPDSAAAYYGEVVARFPRSERAPTALYKLGRLEEDRKNPVAARAWYQRLIRDYPGSQDADLARDQLKQLRP